MAMVSLLAVSGLAAAPHAVELLNPGISIHTAPGAKSTLKVNVGAGITADIQKIEIDCGGVPIEVPRYVGTGPVPAGMFRAPGAGAANRDIEFGTTPSEDCVVQITWFWPAGDPAPTVSTGTWS